jgi:TolA-binding protein
VIHLRSTGRLAAAAIGLCALFALPALAQRQQASPEQRLERLERQLLQMQRQVFPKGRPADTAGFADEPAATQSSVVSLAQRLDSLERQMADLVRLSEENAGRLRSFESDLEAVRRDQRERFDALDQKIAAAAAAAAQPAVSADPEPSSTSPRSSAQPDAAEQLTATPGEDAGEIAYTEGFRLWEAGRHDAAIQSLRAFVSAFPKHRRVSFANNLIGRAMLDKGDARAAVQAFVANYRGNPGGERAPDSLYYLGQAFMKLGQPAQACNAFSELDEVYGSKIRPELKKLQTEAKDQAQCNS